MYIIYQFYSPTGVSSVGPRFEGCVCVFGGVRGSNLGSVCVCHFPLICSKWWSLVKPHFFKKKKKNFVFSFYLKK